MLSSEIVLIAGSDKRQAESGSIFFLCKFSKIPCDSSCVVGRLDFRRSLESNAGSFSRTVVGNRVYVDFSSFNPFLSSPSVSKDERLDK